jgi:hypothetical protein
MDVRVRIRDPQVAPVCVATYCLANPLLSPTSSSPYRRVVPKLLRAIDSPHTTTFDALTLNSLTCLCALAGARRSLAPCCPSLVVVVGGDAALLAALAERWGRQEDMDIDMAAGTVRVRRAVSMRSQLPPRKRARPETALQRTSQQHNSHLHLHCRSRRPLCLRRRRYLWCRRYLCRPPYPPRPRLRPGGRSRAPQFQGI